MHTPPINGKNDFPSSAAGDSGVVEVVSGASATAPAFSPVGFVESSLESSSLDCECCDVCTRQLFSHSFLNARFGFSRVFIVYADFSLLIWQNVSKNCKLNCEKVLSMKNGNAFNKMMI